MEVLLRRTPAKKKARRRSGRVNWSDELMTFGLLDDVSALSGLTAGSDAWMRERFRGDEDGWVDCFASAYMRGVNPVETYREYFYVYEVAITMSVVKRLFRLFVVDGGECSTGEFVDAVGGVLAKGAAVSEYRVRRELRGEEDVRGGVL
jgi:hypothetical protein